MKRLDERGFSLFESIIHLLIFTILIQLTVFFFFWKTPIQSNYQEDYFTDWELFSIEVQEMVSEVYSIEEVSPKRFRFYTERGRITLELYNSMIRKLVFEDGHVPMLVDLKSCTFSLEDNRLTIAVEKLDGIHKEGTFAIGLRTQ